MRNPAFFSTGRISASISQSARAMPETGGFEACPVIPPPSRLIDDVEILRRVGGQQRLLHLVLENFEREVGYPAALRLIVMLTLARLHVYASHSGLTTTYGVYNFHNSLLNLV